MNIYLDLSTLLISLRTSYSTALLGQTPLGRAAGYVQWNLWVNLRFSKDQYGKGYRVSPVTSYEGIRYSSWLWRKLAYPGYIIRNTRMYTNIFAECGMFLYVIQNLVAFFCLQSRVSVVQPSVNISATNSLHIHMLKIQQ